VVNTLDPDILVMGGGMSNIEELYTDLPPELARQVFSTVFATPHAKGGPRRFERRSWRCLALESNLTQLPDLR